MEKLKEAAISFVGNLTFLEIYEQNHWNFNVNITYANKTHDNFLLNYVTTPDVVVWSAVIASCAIPGVFD